MFRHLRRWLSSRQSSTTPRGPKRCRPFVEALEDRLAPAILTVNSAADSVDHSNGFLTLREAIQAVNAGSSAALLGGELAQVTGTFGNADEIRFDPSIGTLIALNGSPISIARSVSLTGPGGGGLTISGGEAARLFTITDSNASVQQTVSFTGLELTNGSTTSGGGAIHNSENLTLIGCTFSNNTAGTGGGAIFSQGTSSVTAINSTFSGNSAETNGGAIIVIESATLTAIHCTFAFNQADSDNNGVGTSGSISRFSSATVNLQSCIIASNTRASASDDLTGIVLPQSSNNLIGNGTGLTGITNGTQGNQIGTAGSPIFPLLNGLTKDAGSPTSTHGLFSTSPALNGIGSTPTLITPLTVTADSIDDPNPVSNLIDNGGLSGTPTAANIGSITHAAGVAGESWYAVSPSASTSDYFADNGPVTLTFSLGGTFDLTNLVLWGFDFLGNGPDDNEAKGLDVRFSTDGGATYPTSVVLQRAAPTGANAEILPFGTTTANFVQIRIFDNFFGRAGGDGSGDLVGLGEVKFLGRPAAATPFLITPTAVTTNTAATDATPVQRLTDNSGLSGTAFLHNATTVTHAAASTETAWSTTSSGTDYFTAGTAPVLTFSLGGTFNLTHLVVWGYDFLGDGANDNNEARTFQLEFSTDGGANFAAPIAVTRAARSGLKSNTLTLGKTYTANAVRVTVTDNFFGVSGGAGGDRVALGEVKFHGSSATDQTGRDRVAIGAADIGAYEFPAPPGNSLVVTNASDEMDGNLATGNLSLREAIAIANEREGVDTISFAANVTTVNLTLGQLLLTDPAKTTINGGAGVTIQRSSATGTGQFRIFAVEGGTVDLNNLTIRNGAAVFIESGEFRGGGGLINNGGTVTFTNSTVSNNSTKYSGGGLANNGGTMMLTSTTVANNSAAFFLNANSNLGGGIFNSSQGTVKVFFSTVSGNTASGDGGGIYSAGILDVLTSTIGGNQSTGNSGGGIASVGSSSLLTINGATFAGNASFLSGGGIFIGSSGSNNYATNTTVSSNTAALNGGGISVGSGVLLTLVHSTVTLNTADSETNFQGAGGGLFSPSNGNVTLNNTLVAGNIRSVFQSPDDLAATVSTSSRNNLIGDPSTAGGLAEGSNGNLLGTGSGGVLPIGVILDTNLASNNGPTQTHALLATGRALNAGNNSLALLPNAMSLVSDQRGLNRQVGSNVDIGAFEYQGPNLAPINSLPATKQKLKKKRLFTFGGLLSTADLDAGAGAIRVSIAVTKGKLILTAANNVTISGSNTKTIALTGTVSAVNAALAALQYKPNSTYIGGVKLTMTTNDQGNSGNPLTDVDVLKLGLS